MYLYNVSIIVEDSQNELLLNWISKTWIPSITHSEVRFLKMLNSPHEGQTYSMQLLFSNLEEIKVFKEEKLIELQIRIGENHTEKAFIFDSTMQYLSF